ncbi:hypothetical protein CAPTEDRAFT_197212 [Capitella teleta]|uniref:G-protein coupled receptors family 1 profile domain-containing protein n=1 Tax=Capitella teleta TaxID=283909 RepID=R7UHK4_CAPTE|nr:hypothetical protein CAPTEDRAFT_197212 [Capitella teleta]|eukprot:ELU02757.1 hypothetical protein CAPTEDRAFT_197212 [Capitella teleta]
MNCEKYIVSNYTHHEVHEEGSGLTGALPRYERVLMTRIVVAVCCFGVLGNVLNLVALTRRSLVSRMGKMEKSATAGLVGLALSDFLFCIINFPNAFVDPDAIQWLSLSFDAFYRVYGTSVGDLGRTSAGWRAYIIVYFILAVLIPLLTLAFCNVYLIVKRDIVDIKTHTIYNFVVSILNVLQVISFSFNFVLYILINAHFRKTIKELFSCRKSPNSHNSHASYDSVTQQTTVLPLTRMSNGKNNEA